MLAQQVEQASITKSPVVMPRLTTIISIIILLALSGAVTQLRAQSDSPCNQGRAIAPAVDPRNEHAECFPELGRTEGSITDCVATFGAEIYGHDIGAVGDVNNDGLNDWIVAHQRCDIVVVDRYPIDLLLYKGVRGGLPSVESGERIGPSEVGSITEFLAAGDWDDDGHRDIAVRIQILGDTNAGNTGYDIAKLVVFWGDSFGSYSLHDTTQLSSGAEMWLGLYQSVSTDLDGDGVEDLIIRNSNGLAHGQIYQLPYLQIFHGHSHERWGQGHIGTMATWSYWNRPYFRRDFSAMSAIDQDHDGAMDLALYENTSAGVGSIGIIYGRKGGGLPDTTEFENITLDSANGHFSLFSDLTGDGIPELLMTCGSQDQIKLFIGLQGQRLRQQYGSGNQPPQPDSTQWWGHPWATLSMPRKVNPNWFGDYHELYDLGDGNLDGIDDIWCFSWPYLLCYSGGVMLDSLVDGLVRVPLSGVISAARLGDIDGSGVATMAVSYDGSHSAEHAFPGGIIYIKPSRSIPRDGTPRRLPEGTDRPASEVPEEDGRVGETPWLSRNGLP
jgi:hypothetical protein